MNTPSLQQTLLATQNSYAVGGVSLAQIFRGQLCEGLAMGVVDDCVICACSRAPSVAGVRELEALAQELFEETGRPVSLLLYVAPQAGFLSESERAVVQGFYHRTGRLLGAVAQVAEGSGLWASTARVGMKAMAMFQRTPSPPRVFAERAQAIDWLLARPAPKHDACNTGRHAPPHPSRPSRPGPHPTRVARPRGASLQPAVASPEWAAGTAVAELARHRLSEGLDAVIAMRSASDYSPPTA